MSDLGQQDAAIGDLPYAFGAMSVGDGARTAGPAGEACNAGAAADGVELGFEEHSGASAAVEHPARADTASGGQSLDIDDLMTDFFLPSFDEHQVATANLLRFSPEPDGPCVLGANLDAIHAGGWTVEVAKRWGLREKDMKQGLTLPPGLAKQVGKQVSWDDPQRKRLLRLAASWGRAFSQGTGQDTVACVVSGPRGTGKSAMFEALAAGIMLSSPPLPVGEGYKIYCGVLRRPIFLQSGDSKSNPFAALPRATKAPMGNAIPMSPVLAGLEVLRLHGVCDLPGGGIHERKSNETKHAWAVWSREAYEANAFNRLSQWLQDHNMGLILFLDEWQRNMDSNVDEPYRLLIINQLSEPSYMGPSEAMHLQVVLGGSSSIIGPALRFSGALVGREKPHLDASKSAKSTIAVPKNRLEMHHARLRVVQLSGVQTLEQLERLLVVAKPTVKPPTGVANLLSKLSAERGANVRADLIRGAVVKMANGKKMSLGDVLEQTGGNCRTMLRMIFGETESEPEDSGPKLQAMSLDSQPQLTSLYWAMALEIWHTRRRFAEDVASNPAKIDGETLVVSKVSLIAALERLKYLLGQLGYSDEKIKKVLLAGAELDRPQLLFTWADGGYIHVHFDTSQNLLSEPPPIRALQFPSAAHFRAAFAGIASETGTSLASRYIETIQRPEGNHARNEGEFMTFAALGGRRREAVHRTNLGEAALQHLAVSDDTVPAQEKVLQALMEEDDCLPAQTDGWRFAQALCRRLAREGMLLWTNPLVEENDSTGGEAAMGGGGGNGREGTRGSSADVLPPDIARRVEATVQSLRRGGGGTTTRRQDGAIALKSRQAVMRAVLSAALEDFPSAYSTEDEGSRWSQEPSPLRWNPDGATAEGEPFKLGVLYKRDGVDRGVDGIGVVMLPGGVLAISAFQIKLTAQNSSNALRQAALRDAAIHVHYDMAKSGAVDTLVRMLGAKGVIPVLVLASNRESSVGQQRGGSAKALAPVPAERAGMGAAGAPPGRTDARGSADAAGGAGADSLDGEELTLTSGWNVAKAAQQGSTGGDEVAFDWVADPGEGVEAFNAVYRNTSGASDAKPYQFVPRGGAAIVLTRNELNGMWPAPIRLFANEHNISCFGGVMSEMERKELERAAWPAGAKGSLFEMYRRLVEEEKKRVEEERERQENERERQKKERERQEKERERQEKERELEEEERERQLEERKRQLEAERERQEKERERQEKERERQEKERELEEEERERQLEERKRQLEERERENEERRRRGVDLANQLSLQASHPLIEFLVGAGCSWESLMAMDEGALSDLGELLVGMDQPVATKNIIRVAWWNARRQILSRRLGS